MSSCLHICLILEAFLRTFLCLIREYNWSANLESLWNLSQLLSNSTYNVWFNTIGMFLWSYLMYHSQLHTAPRKGLFFTFRISLFSEESLINSGYIFCCNLQNKNNLNCQQKFSDNVRDFMLKLHIDMLAYLALQSTHFSIKRKI